MATIEPANISIQGGGGAISDTNQSNAPAANTAAFVFAEGITNRKLTVDGLRWSYNAAPTGGSIVITSGARTLDTIYVTSAGPGFMPGIWKGDTNANLNVVLSAGGAAVKGAITLNRIFAD